MALAAEHALGWPPAALPVLVAGCSALAALAMLAQVRGLLQGRAGQGPRVEQRTASSCPGSGYLRARPLGHDPGSPTSVCPQPHHRLPHPPTQVDLLSPTTSPANKAIACFWGLAGFAAALALHVLQPGCACRVGLAALPAPTSSSVPARIDLLLLLLLLSC